MTDQQIDQYMRQIAGDDADLDDEIGGPRGIETVSTQFGTFKKSKKRPTGQNDSRANKSSGALEIDEEAMGVEVNSAKNDAHAGFSAEDISFA